MLKFFRNIPIKRKLTLIAMLTSGASLLFSGAGFMVYDQFAFKREMVVSLDTLAEMTGFNCAAALSFDDPGSAEQTLKGNATQPRIVAAFVYDESGAVFASYQRDPAPVLFEPPPAGAVARFGADHIELFRPIVFDGGTIGTIHLRSDLEGLRQRQRTHALIVAGVALASMLLAYAIATRLRRLIADPVSLLSAAAVRVTTEQNYSVRVERAGDDELGRLTDAFNSMLAQIQTRDAALRAAHDQLEKRVAERTAELAYERDLLRVLLDSSPDSIYFKDRDSRFVLISRSKVEKMLELVPGLRERLLGPGADPAAHVDAQHLVGLSDADAYTGEHAKRALEDEQKIMCAGQPLIGQVEKQTYLDGTVCWFLTSKMPWRDRDGATIGTFGISKDITKLKQAEEQLEQIHRKLLDASRSAGMAEVATGVLHNVGNVLNSVNVSATLVADTVRQSKADNLGKLGALLAGHQDDLADFLGNDPRGRMVQPYLLTLADELAREQQSMLKELDQLRKNVDHIKEIVAMQQNYARTSGIVEAISVPDLVEDAIRMNVGSLARHDVALVRDYQARPVVVVDKHKVLQILVNLIRNAKYACDESGRADKRITMKISNGDGTVKIAIADNGVGIPAENMTRIFNHGFTTRASGHGYGLHSGALAAREMGGSLDVFSQGVSRGATFVLTVPFIPDNPDHA